MRAQKELEKVNEFNLFFKRFDFALLLKTFAEEQTPA